jgi:diguanylate cyclase (GGDEF)-like protein
MAPLRHETRRRREMARSAAALFAAAALVTGLGLLLPHVPQVDEAGLVGVSAGAALLAVTLLVARERIPEAAYLAVAAVGVVLVSLALYFNGERHGGPSGGDEMYYLWIVLWSAYYLSRRSLAVQVALVLAAYGATLIAIDPGPNGTSRWISLSGLVIGAAIVVRVLSERVDRLIGELRRAASTDPLTGLPNRRGLEAAYDLALAAHRRSGEQFALIVADLDRFKELNDRRGHRAGDEALEQVADLLRREVRGVDTAARIGGDEFALLLPASDADTACHVARRVQTSIDAHARDAGWPASISLGVGVSDRDGADLDALIRHADERMYRAKRGDGRRRTAV